MLLSFEFLDPISTYEKIADLEANVEELKQRLNQIEGIKHKTLKELLKKK